MARILVVDDQPELVQIVREYLAQHGHTATGASNGQEALEHLGRETFDLVLTDIIMPVKDGYDLLKEILKHKPGLKVIVTSGQARVGNIDFLRDATQLGADATLAKPFRPQELLETIERLLKP